MSVNDKDTNSNDVNLSKNKKGTLCVVDSIFPDGKTCSVFIERYVKHPLYGKRMKTKKRALCHLSIDGVNPGKKVFIKYKKFSKRKNFEVVDVL